MRVLALITDSVKGYGGIAQTNRDVLESLAQIDTVDEVVVLPRYLMEPLSGFHGKIKQKSPQKSKIRFVLSALNCLRQEKHFDLIYCGHIFMAPLSAWLAKIAKARLWIHTYGIEAWERRSRLIQRSVEKAALVTSISRHTRRRFMNWIHLDPERLRVLPVIVRSKFQPGPKPAHLLRRYQLQEKKVLLTVGRFSQSEKYKGHDRVISVLPRLIQNHPELIYVIAGEGDDRPRLDDLARKLGVEQSVKFIGPVAEDELVDVYRMADVFVMPSHGEGFGIVFLEASCCGVPVVGGNADGSFDALVEGRIGRSIDVNDPNALIRAIEENLKIPVIAGDQARIFCMKNMTDFLKDLLEHRILCE